MHDILLQQMFLWIKSWADFQTLRSPSPEAIYMNDAPASTKVDTDLFIVFHNFHVFIKVNSLIFFSRNSHLQLCPHDHHVVKHKGD